MICESPTSGGGARRALLKLWQVTVIAIFYPFSLFCEIEYLPSEPVKTAKHSPKSISEGGRIWQVWSPSKDESLQNIADLVSMSNPPPNLPTKIIPTKLA